LRKLISLLCAIPILLSGDRIIFANDGPTDPVVLIPGILGSRLCDTEGTVLWGRSARGSLSNFHLLDLTDKSSETIKPCGIVDKIQVLGPLYSVGAYSSLLDTMRNDWGLVEGANLFVFDYDWRKSNVDNEVAFEQFVVSKLGPDKKFNIVAHSMGGLIARLNVDHLDQQNQPRRVNKIIYLGSPFLGSMSTLGTLSEGWGRLPNWLAGGIGTIQHVALSFPSLLELLPRYDKCCSFKKENGQYVAIDVFDPQVWKTNKWLPADMRDGPRFAEFANNLKRASQLTSILRAPTPGLIEVRFASDSRSTRFIFTAKEGQTSPSRDNWHFSFERGDSTVPVWSAAREPGLSTIAGALQSFGEHSTIFDDDWVRSELKRELFTAAAVLDRPIAGKGFPIIQTKVGGQRRDWSLERIEVTPAETYVALNSIVETVVGLKFSGDARDFISGTYTPRVVLRQDNETIPTDIVETTSREDEGNHTLKFRCTGKTTTLHEGVVEVSVQLPSALPAIEAKEFVVLLQQ
jgi:pimeloyl-ACP methyl ester carboxylesterase